MRNNRLFTSLFVGLLALGSFSFAAHQVQHKEVVVVSAASNQSEPPYQNHDADTYYDSISSSDDGEALLAKLRSLNSSRRKRTLGYKSLGSYYKYTDYDPDTVEYDERNQPYGTRILSYYSATSTISFNKEHVWPDSRGGGSVEGDIHMPRPTISAENSSRGNSFFVEGKYGSSGGWDPNAYGLDQVRGDAARIIFYCVVASSTLSLVDLTEDNKTNKTMGKLSDMIKWHLQYDISQREMNRNEGAEYLQGNRNPFIDHPEYVCRIWGKYNSTIENLCKADPYAGATPTEIILSSNSLNLSLYEKTKLSVAAVVPNDANKNVKWVSSNPEIVTIDSNGNVEAMAVGEATIYAKSTLNENITASCSVIVNPPETSRLEEVSISVDKTTIGINKTAQLSYTLSPNFIYPFPTVRITSSDSNILRVDENGLITGVAKGKAEVIVTARQELEENEDIIQRASIEITVEESTYEEGTLVVDRSSFKSTSSSYNYYNWSVDGVNGTAYIYGGEASYMQFNNSKDDKILLSTTELPGDVLSVRINGAAKSPNKKWTVSVAGNVAQGGKNLDPNTKVTLGTKEVTTEGTLFENAEPNLRYFMLEYADSGASYLTSIEITYGKPKTPIEPEVIHVTGITSEFTTLSLEEEEEAQLSWQIEPENADDKSVVIKVNNENILIDETGYVIAVSAGESIVTITTVDGDFSITITIEILEKETPPVDPDPIDPDPDDPDPIDPDPDDPDPIDPDPDDPDPIDPDPPVDPDPVDPEPVDPEPVDPEPVNPPDAKAKICGGNIAFTSIVLSVVSLLGIAILVLGKKKHEKD